MRSPIQVVLTAFFGMFISANAFAAVYCKVVERGEMKIYDATAGEGYLECIDLLSEGSACFTGSRREVVALINDRTFDWGGTWLEGAHYKGFFEVSYVYVDPSRGQRSKLSMERCLKNFFKSPAVGPVKYRY